MATESSESKTAGGLGHHVYSITLADLIYIKLVSDAVDKLVSTPGDLERFNKESDQVLKKLHDIAIKAETIATANKHEAQSAKNS